MIEIGKYVIYKCMHSHRFNLYERYTFASKRGGVDSMRTVEKHIAFGINLKECVHKITLDKTMDEGEILTMTEAVNKYERIHHEVVCQLEEISSRLMQLIASEPEEETEEELEEENYSDEN